MRQPTDPSVLNHSSSVSDAGSFRSAFGQTVKASDNLSEIDAFSGMSSPGRTRSVYAKGWGAHGVLRIHADISHLTCAKVFEPGRETPMIARFSSMVGEPGAADHERVLHGFSLKFYTPEGNWDVVGTNMPVFFLRDPNKFTNFIRTQKRDPRTNLQDKSALWNFWSRSPESLHLLTMLFSDRGLPSTPMHMNGYGNHTYSLLKTTGERVWVKFHLKTLQGNQYCTDYEAEQIIARTRDGYQEALFTSIESGKYPKWIFSLQVMTQTDATEVSFDPFDVTKVWPHADFPLIQVGTFELNKNSTNYYSDIEQLAFSPANIVRGIGHSPDRMLQSRIAIYHEAQHGRLGIQYGALPINQSRGSLREAIPRPDPHMSDSESSDEASGLYGGLDCRSIAAYPFLPTGEPAPFTRLELDDFGQPRMLFLRLGLGQRARLFGNLATSLKDVPSAIVERQIDLFTGVHPEYGAGVCAALDAFDPQF